MDKELLSFLGKRRLSLVKERQLLSFLGKRRLSLVSLLGRGHSSQIFLVKNNSGKKLVAKAERQDSTRLRMAEREVQCLELANGLGIGPRLIAYDFKKRIILMEFIRGKTLAEWIFSGPEKKQLKSFIALLLQQAAALDGIGLDHGQLAGSGKNILARNGKPVIIDFEKASLRRKCHNLKVLESFLSRNPHGAIAKKVKEILGKKEAEKFIP